MQQPLAAGKSMEMDFLLEPLEATSPANSQFYISETHVGTLTSRTVREWICVILSHQVCDHILQQP